MKIIDKFNEKALRVYCNCGCGNYMQISDCIGDDYIIEFVESGFSSLITRIMYIFKYTSPEVIIKDEEKKEIADFYGITRKKIEEKYIEIGDVWAERMLGQTSIGLNVSRPPIKIILRPTFVRSDSTCLNKEEFIKFLEFITAE